MDGNQRWSKNNYKTKKDGYVKGLNKLIEITNFCIDHNISYLTVYALSTENISRNSVKLIFNIIKSNYQELLEKFADNKEVKINIIGEKKNISPSILKIFDNLQLKTKNNNKLKLNIAFNYGSEDELLNIIKKINFSKTNNFNKLTIKEIKQYSYLGNIPEPDLLIRTGGYQRLSNFILIYLKYTELFFTNTLWPEISLKEIEDIFNKFYKIKRKYGL